MEAVTAVRAHRRRFRVVARGLVPTCLALLGCGGNPNGTAWPPDDRFIQFDQASYTLDTGTQQAVAVNVLVYGSSLPEVLTVQLHVRPLDSFDDLSIQTASVKRVGPPPHRASFVVPAPTDPAGHPVRGWYRLWAHWKVQSVEWWVNAGFFVQ